MSSVDEYLPDRVEICECWARDGIQAWSTPLSLSDRVELINKSLEAGFAEVELGAMVPARTTPQFTDMAELLPRIRRPDGVGGRVLVPNSRGMERLLQVPGAREAVTAVGTPVSASERHNLANMRKSVDEQMLEIQGITRMAAAEGLEVVCAVATAFGCPLEGRVDRERVLTLAERLAEMGVRRIMLSDTTGLADPRGAYELFTLAAARLPGVQLIAHFHDTRGRGIANTLAAFAAGVRFADTAFGGTGGEPHSVAHGHVGDMGNVCTEDLVSVLAQMGVATGIELPDLIELGRSAEKAMGTELYSQVLRSGPGLELLPA